EFGGVDERRLDDARASLERIADVFADADLHAVGGAGAQIEVIDRDRRSASRTVRRDGGSGPKWRSGNRASLNAELLRLAIEDQVRIARYGVTSVRTYFAIRSNSRFTRSPMRAVPRVVRRRVSGIKAAANVDSSGSTTVSETPSTAMDPLLTTRSENSAGKLHR